MYLTVLIINFKCIKKLDLNIENGNKILIKGQNGSGKSTFFNAIEWCLYGGKFSQTNKTPRTKVELIFHNRSIKIQRFKDPVELILTLNDKQYKDIEAQSIITDIFGDNLYWKSSSYVSQREYNKFLSGTSSDKFNLLKNITYGDTMPNISIEKCIKDDINKIDKQIDLQKSKLEDLTDYVVEGEIVDTGVLKCKKEEMIKILSKKESYISQKKELEDKLHGLKLSQIPNIPDIDLFEQKNLHEKLKHINSELSNLNTEYKDIVNEYEISYKWAKNNKKIKTNIIDYICMENENFIKSINSDLTTFYKKCSKGLDILNEIKLFEPSQYDSNLKSYIDELKLISLSKSVYDCPHCNKKIKVDGSQILKVENMSSLRTKESVENDIDTLNNSMKKYNNYLSNVQDLDKNSGKCEDIGDISSININGCHHLDKTPSEIISLYKKIKEEIVSNRDSRMKIENLNKSKNDIMVKINNNYTLNDILEYIDISKHISRYNEIKDILESVDEKLDKISDITDEKLKSIKDELKTIKINNNRIEKGKQYKEIDKKIKKLINDYLIMSNTHDFVKGVSYEFMENITKCITYNSNDFLKYIYNMSGDNYPQLILDTIKCTESTKVERNEVNITVNHNSVIFNGINGMSGGESTLISIALYISLNRINNEMLILDEALSSIHESKIPLIFEKMFEILNDKTILVVHHGLKEEYLFDVIIDIENIIQ